MKEVKKKQYKILITQTIIDDWKVMDDIVNGKYDKPKQNK